MKSLLICLCICTATFLSCDLFQPRHPDQTAGVSLHLHYGYPETAEGIQKNRDRAVLSPQPPLHKTQSDSLVNYLFDKLSIVFYDLHTNEESIIDYYYNERIYELLESFKGDSTNFETYWLRRDQNMLDMVTDGNFDIEFRSVLPLKDGRFYAEYELSPGLKSYRIGCYKGDSLVAVAPHEDSYTASVFALGPNISFELHAHAIPIDQINNINKLGPES